MTSFAVARFSVLKDAGWSAEDDDLLSAPEIKIVISGNRHGSFECAARYLGFERKSVLAADTDDIGQMLPVLMSSRGWLLR